MFVGFCTNSGLGSINNCNNPESVYYGGFFYEGGIRTDNLESFKIGEVIGCEADLKSGFLRWYKTGSLFKECKIPLQMKEKTIYLSVIMYESGDEIELSL